MRKWMDSDLKIVPKISAIPADGMSKLPLRIEVYNGFGRPKKMRSDTYVELEATSGRIEGVTIPSHKSFADAVITSSKEFGTVTIKAKLGDKAVASAPVEYKLEGGSLAVTISPSMILADSNSSAAINIRVRNSKGNYVTPLADKVIELSTTQGNIVGSVVRLAARADSANAVIVSGGATGIATVTASMGTLKGMGRVEFRGVSRQICANCGETIPRDFDTCPSCGHASPQAENKEQAPVENKEQAPAENKESVTPTT
jgi:rRNA maturation endonuclease Nob1